MGKGFDKMLLPTRFEIPMPVSEQLPGPRQAFRHLVGR
jgi:hypothetical protein